MTTEPDLFDTFLQFEREFSAFDLQINDVPIWERLRRDVYSQLTFSEDSTNIAVQSVISNIQRIIEGVGLWGKNSVHKNPYTAGQHDYLFWGHQRRKLLEDDLWWDIYFDHFYDSVDFDYLHLELAHWTSHLTPAKTNSLRYMDFPVYSGTIARKLFSSHYPIDSAHIETLHEMAGKLHEVFGVHIDLTAMVKKKLIQRWVRKPLYKHLLHRIDPEIVALVVSYHRETFIEVCKEMDIPVVELQHGIIHSRHLGYAYPGNKSKQTFPDYLFVFGEYWKDAVEYPIPTDCIYTTGYPHLEAQRERYLTHESTDQVVFVSQPTTGKELSQLAIKFADISNRPIVYKLHPHEYKNWQQDYPALAQSDIHVVSHDPQLYKLLAESAVQVGVNSTVLYEGQAFELDTYLFDDVSTQISPLKETEYATCFSTAEELLEAVAEKRSLTGNTNKFFETNAIQKMENAFSEIVRKDSSVLVA